MLWNKKQIVELPLFAEARVHPQYKQRRFSLFTLSAVYLFIMVAIFCGVFYPLAIREYDKQLRANAAALPDYSNITPPVPFAIGRPVKLDVPSVGISIAVVDGSYDTVSRTWTLHNDIVQFDISSKQANSRSGNTFIYGHATDKVFGPLLRAQPGVEAILTTDTGFTFTYKLSSHEIVDPTNVGVLNYNGPSRLMLQTCTGPTLSEFRQLFYFDYVTHKRI